MSVNAQTVARTPQRLRAKMNLPRIFKTYVGHHYQAPLYPLRPDVVGRVVQHLRGIVANFS